MRTALGKSSAGPDRVREAIRPETKLLWVETPTNPLLKVTDLEVMATIARTHSLLLAVDSTFATPALLRPLELGVDLVIHSTTKYISGHNQLIGDLDLLIAATCLYHELTLLTTNPRHFARIPDLTVVSHPDSLP